jgi:G3E family GTPase
MVPVVVLTGFLGAGKTTLINRLLARGRIGRIGVIVNELGAVGIDGALLGSDARQVELPGGCVCCQLGEDLARTVVELVDNTPGLQALLVETTGVAEPIPIAWTLERSPACERVRVGAVVTVVDAENFLASRAVTTACDAQVAYADVILVTKAALSDEARAAVRALAPRAELREGTTDDHAAWLEQVLADPDVERVGRSDGHDHGDDHRDHLVDVATAWTVADGVLDLEELEARLAALPARYVRVKGIVRAVDGRTGDAAARWTAVHRVGLRVSSEPVRAPAGWSSGKLVALGPAVDAETLAACVSASVTASVTA